MFIVANLIKLFTEPFIWATIINIVQRDGVSQSNIMEISKFLLLLVLIELCFWLFHGPARVLERSTAFKVRINYRKYFLRGVMGIPLAWHNDNHSGDTYDKMEKGTTSLYNFAEDSFEVIYSIAQLIICYGMLVYINYWAGLVVLATSAVSVWVTIHYDRQLVPMYKELSRSENRIAEHIFDAVSNITTIIVLRAERLIYGSICQQIEAPYELDRTSNKVSETKWFLVAMICKFTTSAVIAVYLWTEVSAGRIILAGTVVLLMTYLRRIEDVYFRFTGMYSDIIKRRARIGNAEELASHFKNNNLNDHVLPADWNSLTITGLRFSYGPEMIYPLYINELTIRHGERIAFVGESGSGKSTTLKLIRDLFRPKSLRLTVDGKEIPHGFEGISRAITLVPQEPEVFTTTIERNITLGGEYTEEMLGHYLHMACFDEFISQLPKGLQSATNEKGVNLSGGQKQRLALARGLLAGHDKDIILLDEPTSSLDTVTGEDVYTRILGGFKGRTIISSTHHLHTLRHFDRVVVFDRGEIVGQGKIDDLLQTCPKFMELWSRYKP